MTLDNVLGMGGVVGWIALIIVIVFWFVLTVFILCIMEVRVLDRDGYLYTLKPGRLIYCSITGIIGVFARAPSSLGRSQQQAL